ncbi:MAG: BamA/TamA family outer membrane protein [candidate division KSB1 bacterium]|nr:BamA/TamA family outer membrane protein [candidate division KSB1 bacterium]
MNLVFASDDAFYSGLSDAKQDVAERMQKKYLGDADELMRFNGDAEIKTDETITGHLFIVSGTLNIQGRVQGDVLAVFADVELGRQALVEGDIVIVNGKLWNRDGSIIRGDIVKTTVPLEAGEAKDHEVIRRRDDEPYTNKRDWLDDDHEPMYADYNRVDGLTIGYSLPQRGWWAEENHRYAILGWGGYSFASKDWQYKLALERWTQSDHRFGMGIALHDYTATQDAWLNCDHENALAAGLFKSDYRDYYIRSGFGIYAGQTLGRRTLLKLGYYEDEFYNINNHTNWALFGGKRNFRENPSALPPGLVVQKGKNASMLIKSIKAELTLDTRDDPQTPTRGWMINGLAEKTADDIGDNISFERYILDIRRYQPLSWDEVLSIRVRGATSSGLLPPLYLFDLGGISTLRGYKFKEFTGDRMLLGNIEYRMNASKVKVFDFDIILFLDTGLAWFANEDNRRYANGWMPDKGSLTDANNIDPRDTFDRLTWKDMKTDAGIGLAASDNTFRINIARRLDKRGSDFYVTFRICKTF